ncbi:MAG: nitrate ABC transporter substrate-binding protein [Epulopiscium sp. Nele67-Bin005]|nr:MAG: nitrate ABC transporter substrate-binding protein [Epulopiscium sp. Nele67-Bin005]
MKKIKSVMALLLSVSIFSLVGCSSETAEGNDKILLAEVAHSVFYAPQYVAIEKGFFEEEGIEIELVGAQGADKTMASLLSKEVQIGFMGPEASIYIHNQGSADYAISFAQLTKRDGSFLVGRYPEPNFEISDLAGKEIIGGRPGGVPLMSLEYVIKQSGIEVGEDVGNGQANVRSDVQFSVMAGAFLGGEGDYVSLFEPTPTTMENDGTGYIVASLGEQSGELPYTAYCALDSYIEENPDIIQRFTNAIYKGQQFVKDAEAAEIAEIISPQFIEIELEDLTTIVQRYKDIDAWSETPILEEESFNRLMDIMDLAGELTERADFNALVDNQFAIEAVKSNATKALLAQDVTPIFELEVME